MTMVLINVWRARFQMQAQYFALQILAGLAGSVNDTIIQMTVRPVVSILFTAISVSDLIFRFRYRISLSTSGLL